jgi:broad specificity phosphatase PhoE
MERMKTIRHVEEVNNDLSVARDGHIDSGELYIIDDYHVPEILECIEEKSPENVDIICSDTERSQETSEYLKLKLEQKTTIPVTVEIDPRSNPLHHGTYKKGITPDNPLVKSAKKIYIQETFVNKNPWYRYGDIQGIQDAYSDLGEIFIEPGECQAELTIRLYRLFLDLLERMEAENKTLFVLSTHYVVITRLLSLQYISQSKSNFHMFYSPNAELYMHEWEAGNELMKDYDFHDFFKVHNYIFDIDMAEIGKIRNAIETDLNIFVAGYMQRYGKEI